MPEQAGAAPTVVVTRPLAQALPLQQRIIASGRHAVVFPLLAIEALTDFTALDAVLAGLERFAMVAFVSPNAIDAAFARRAAWPAGVALAVMGEGSRQALAAHGVTDASHRIHQPRDRNRTDSQTLLEALDLDLLAGREVLILRGDGGRELLADGLRAAGVQVTQVAAYRRAAPAVNAATEAQLAQLLQADATWIITSSEALQILVAMAAALPAAAVADMVGGDGGSVGVGVGIGVGIGVGVGRARLCRQRLLVPHARIAETAKTLGFCNVMQCASGDESILAALQFRNE